MDAQFVRGMLKNPDIQPNATINRWIAAIHLFDFELIHMPASKHHGPDGLSWREPAEGEDEDDNPEEWIDSTLSLGLWAVSWVEHQRADLRTLTVGVLLALPVDDTDAPAFPISDKACKADEHLARVRKYLTTLQRPNNINNTSLARLLAVAKRFFLTNGRLWQR